MTLSSRSLPLRRQEGFMFFPLTLKSRKGNAGWVILGRTFSLLTRTLQVPAHLRDPSAHLRPVLTCPRAAQGDILRYLTHRRPLPGTRCVGGRAGTGARPSRPAGTRTRVLGAMQAGPALLRASCLQVQTTKKAQVSDALKIST